MLVVADTTPLSTLAKLGSVEILEPLFRQVLIPPEVAAELSDPHAPHVVRALIVAAPTWLSVRAPRHIVRIPQLDEGEEAAINLAHELHATLLIDDRDGRRCAVQPPYCLKVIGTIGILEQASARALIDLRSSLSRLPDIGFHVTDEILNEAIARYERRQRKR